MRHIQRLVLKNYRSLADIDLEMRPLNVLIGRNGSGKSNFLSFFQLLFDGANENLSRSISNLGGFSQLAYFGKPNPIIEWGIAFSSEDVDPKTIYYRGVLFPQGNGYSIRLEEAERDPFPGYDNRFKFLSASDGRIRILQKIPDQQDDGDIENPQELAIAQIRSRVRYPVLSEIRETLADWQVFRGFGSDALTNIRGPQLLTPVERLRLLPSGENLVSVLNELANNATYDDVNERLTDVMRTVFDDFKQLDTPLVAAGRGTLNYRSKYFPNKQIPALLMSDGQLRFLGLAVLLLLPNPPPLIAIDEPEIGMHPRMLAVFAELLKEASERTQIVVSTHSPQLINHLSPEDIIVVDQDTQSGATTLRHLETEKLNVWLERYSLGQLWTMGRLDKVATA